MDFTLTFKPPYSYILVIWLVYELAKPFYALVKFLVGRYFHKKEYYTEAEMESFQKAATDTFGEKSPFIFHEKESPDVHIDILIFPPNDRCPFYTVCTMGVGAHRMNVPPQEMQERAKDCPELKALMFPGWERTELMMYLPADWKPMWMTEGASEAEITRSYWPIKTLKDAARYMIYADTWYAFSQTFSFGEPFFPDSDYVAMAFAAPLPDCRTPGFTLKAGEKDVSVLQLIPLTGSEYEAIKADNAYTWLLNFLPADSEGINAFLQERMKNMGL